MTFLLGKVDGVEHADGASTVGVNGLAQGTPGASASGRAAIQGSLVLDATGHARRLVKYDQKFDPGYQGAYGVVAGGARFFFEGVAIHASRRSSPLSAGLPSQQGGGGWPRVAATP